VSIDPQLAAYYERVARELPSPTQLDVAARRARMEAIAQRFPAPPDRVDRSDHWVALPGREILVRLYRPLPGTLPALVYFHGGGWIAGSVFTHDGICAALAGDAQVVVASVHYRRPPENPFPAPNDDAYAACEWVAVNAKRLGVDPARLAVGGDSAGAHLAAGVTLEARERRGPAIAFQLLVYPVIAPDFETASYLSHAVTPSLTRADMIEYWHHYLPDLATRDPRAVPMRAVTLVGLPRAHVVVAGLDPLRDEGVRYAELLTQAGVATTCVETPALTHGFLRAAPFVAAARDAQRALGRAAGAAFV
jgi:acetyl esterase